MKWLRKAAYDPEKNILNAAVSKSKHFIAQN
jgi:hypothetical protein